MHRTCRIVRMHSFINNGNMSINKNTVYSISKIDFEMTRVNTNILISLLFFQKSESKSKLSARSNQFSTTMSKYILIEKNPADLYYIVPFGLPNFMGN